ncbi:MAG: response regulator [Calditrichaeota bacterium]|jgi:CheY-like chemotaxis protein|nr:response regulator [Calditrichota bacterium]MBT7788063.1 response regulator [Calditrichota bacterium]
MKNELVILLAEDDEGHATLIKRNLNRAGISNQIICFKDGQETLDFLFREGPGQHRESGKPYLLILDIRMPKIDGVQVLERLKRDPELKKIPVVMLTTTDDPREVDRCHRLGCSSYLTKPVDYERFVIAIRQLGLFLSIVQFPTINGEG